MKKSLIGLITIYQKTLSPDHGVRKPLYPYGYCRHYPSCSEYTKIAIDQFGSMRGVGKGIIRIASCHPWATPRIDLSCYKNEVSHNV